ncbi:actin interacting protein 1 [Trichuris trichiura]|uniref:Actin-interacting protein 1 n=1 Tax=Trichuris trichiura TaxID=36087 RepID=A0A077Z717_TRITR|nr:actin interacting protein 1 [Trichuris trichiura]
MEYRCSKALASFSLPDNVIPRYAESVFAALPLTTRGMPLVINGDPKGKNFLYCNGNSVNPWLSDVYTEHSTPACVAKYSPSGNYIASGDKSGKLRIWDTTQKEHILKKEYQPLAAAIRDVSWSADNQRIAVAGDGRERFAHVFLFETGTSNGNLCGQTKAINSIDFRPTKPLRLVTASEDNSTAIFEGPPFKFKTHSYSHGRFAQCVRYSPSGDVFASCGADGKVFVYDGTEGTNLKELLDPACNSCAHKGGVYALSWNSTGKQLLTASADRTCKIWDVEVETVNDQQLACLWQGDYLLSVSLSGCINYLDPSNPQKPRMVVKGHSKPVTSVAADRENDTFFTGDMEGAVGNSSTLKFLSPKWHSSQVQAMHKTKDILLTVSMDDTLATVKNMDEQVQAETIKLESQPRDVIGDRNMVAVATLKAILLFKDNKLACKEPAPFEATCVALNPEGNLLAVGGQDSKVRLYELKNLSLHLLKEASHHGSVTCVRFSPDGQLLAASDTTRRVVPYSVPSLEPAIKNDWSFHTARVNCLAWSPCNRYIASGSLDTSIIVWDMRSPGEHPLVIKGAHTMSQITSIDWLDSNTLVSVGQDAMVRQWSLTL